MWRYVILHSRAPFPRHSGHERLCESTLCSGHSYFSPLVIGLVERAQASSRESVRAALLRSRARLAAELANVLISIRRRSIGAEGESSKSSIDDFGFCWCQFASTPANQYSVLVIHVFLLSLIGSVEAGPSSFKRVTQDRPGKIDAVNSRTRQWTHLRPFGHTDRRCRV